MASLDPREAAARGDVAAPPAAAEQVPGARPPRRRGPWRYLPIVALAGGVAVYFATGAHRYVSFEALQEHHRALEAFVAANRSAALGLFMLAYILATAVSAPGGATVLSVMGGLLFGLVAGTAAVVIAASIGATIVFLATRSAFGAALRRSGSDFVTRLESGFSQNAFSYMLLLRLVPLFPFVVINIAPALTSIRLRTFFLATLIGIVPGAFAYVSAGNGLGAVLAQGGQISLAGLLTQPDIMIAIAALAVLALIPVAYRFFRRGQDL